MVSTNGSPGGRLLDSGRDGGAGVRNWASILDPQTRRQAVETSLSPVLAGPVALMPDAHLGKGATVGSVIVTEQAIIPAAVGVDIGCGMIAALTDRRLDDLESPAGVLRDIRRGVPAGFDWHQAASPEARRWLEENPIPHPEMVPKARGAAGRVGKQLGTLGGGNHFVEVSSDELGRLWIVLHTGSRGIGNRIATHHIAASARVCAARGRSPSRDLAYYLADDDLFGVYIRQMLWAQSYAWRNRELILDMVWRALKNQMGTVTLLEMINCHHNYAAMERHGGRRVWVTRKGAIRAEHRRPGRDTRFDGDRFLHRAGAGKPALLPLRCPRGGAGAFPEPRQEALHRRAVDRGHERERRGRPTGRGGWWTSPRGRTNRSTR